MSLDCQTKALADICEIKPSKTEARQRLKSSDLVSFVPMEDLGTDQKFVEPRSERKFGQVAGSYTYFANGDVLLAKITPCFENGKLGIARDLTNGIGFGSSEYIVLRPRAALTSEYLYYFLSQDSLRAEGIKSMGGAVGHKRVSKDFIERTQIPVPPLPDQQRIVAILDEAFAALAIAAANTEKNLKNAQELFDSYLQAALNKHDDEWQPHSLNQICSFASGGTPSKANASYWKGDVPWVSGRDMKSDRISNAALHISQGAVEATATRIAPVGSLLVLVRGMGLANGIALAEVISPCAFNQDIKAIHPNPEIHPRFLLYSLRGAFDRSKGLISNAAHGTLRVEMEELRNVSLRIPPLHVQESVMLQMDSLAISTQDVARLYWHKLDVLQKLKQSILQAAFCGELTAPPSSAIKEAAE